VPAIIPIFRRLGIEDAVRALGVHKPGVTFAWGSDDVFRFEFPRFASGPNFPPYAYNVPRPALDDLLVEHARRSGARVVDQRARLEGTGDDGVALDAPTRAAAGMSEAPDFVVDATGRGRMLARLLGIGERRGPRDDVAHFAHFTGFTWDETPGQVLISRLRTGWSWRIPLRGRLSVGVVLGSADAAALGDAPEERLERAIAEDPGLAIAGSGSTRVSPVMTYGNYQLVSARGVGANWALVGDAFGFVDPMLSPGVYLALRSAELVAEGLAPFAKAQAPSPVEIEAALRPYVARQNAMLTAWLDLVATFYDGRMAALFRAGRDWMAAGTNTFKNAAQNHIELHIALQASGMGTLRRYSRGLLRFMGRYGLRGVEPTEMAIR
jgi:flavin-dependent dehydrogenase